MEGDEPVIEGGRGEDKKSLRRRYNSVAEEHPVVQEVIDGYTSFGEALEEIVEDLRRGELSALGDFMDYLTAMVKIAECDVLEEAEEKDLATFHTNYSKRIRKSRRNRDLRVSAIFAAMGGAGEYILRYQPKYLQVGAILKAAGMGGFAGTVSRQLRSLFGGWESGRRFNQVVTILQEEADTLDAEVVEAFYGYIDTVNIFNTVKIDDDEVEIKWAESAEEFEQYKALVESKGNMDMSALDELHPESGEHLLVLAVAGDGVIGGAGLVDEGERLYLDSFIVAEEWRNHGVGSAMVDEIFEHCVFPGHTLAAIVASYVGVNKKKFIGMGFDLLYKKDALEQCLEYKDDDYARRPKNNGCALFLRPKPVVPQ